MLGVECAVRALAQLRRRAQPPAPAAAPFFLRAACVPLASSGTSRNASDTRTHRPQDARHHADGGLD